MRLEIPVLNDRQILKCFHFRYGSAAATCFLHASLGRVAFACAAHSVMGAMKGDRLWLRRTSEWLSFEVSDIVFDHAQDIAVFSLKEFVVTSVWEEPETELFLGHPVVYLGFPHSLDGNYPGQLDFVTPLAKVANYSGTISSGGKVLMILDGVNNPGFSGGPIFHKQGLSDPGKTGLIGIIHAYRYEQEDQGRVFRRSGADGNKLERTDLFVRLNSGMIMASPREFIDKLILRLKVSLEVLRP